MREPKGTKTGALLSALLTATLSTFAFAPTALATAHVETGQEASPMAQRSAVVEKGKKGLSEAAITDLADREVLDRAGFSWYGKDFDTYAPSIELSDVESTPNQTFFFKLDKVVPLHSFYMVETEFYQNDKLVKTLSFRYTESEANSHLIAVSPLTASSVKFEDGKAIDGPSYATGIPYADRVTMKLYHLSAELGTSYPFDTEEERSAAFMAQAMVKLNWPSLKTYGYKETGSELDTLLSQATGKTVNDSKEKSLYVVYDQNLEGGNYFLELVNNDFASKTEKKATSTLRWATTDPATVAASATDYYRWSFLPSGSQGQNDLEWKTEDKGEVFAYTAKLYYSPSATQLTELPADLSDLTLISEKTFYASEGAVVSFKSWDRSLIAKSDKIRLSEGLTAEEVYELAPVPVREGYSFIGWSIEGQTFDRFLTGFSVYNNVNAYAQYKAISFSDLKDKDAWYYDPCVWTIERGLLVGYENGAFGPEDKLTRAQTAQILWRWFDPIAAQRSVSKESVDETGFADVADGQWYTAAVNWAYEKGIMTGYGSPEEALYGVDDTLTREQLCTVIARAAEALRSEKVTSTMEKFFTMPDFQKVSGWAATSVGWCLEKGVIEGVEVETEDDETLFFVEPQADTLRDMMAKVMMNALSEGGVFSD